MPSQVRSGVPLLKDGCAFVAPLDCRGTLKGAVAAVGGSRCCVAMVSVVVVDRPGSHGNEFRECLKNWLIHEQRQTHAMVDACLLLLDENYLLALPLPPGVILPESTGPRNYRFLFCRHVRRLLGWTERRGEGEPHGFSDSVNNFVREVWWPGEVAEALHGAGQQHRQSWSIKQSND